MGRFTAAGERGTFAFRVGRPRLLETDYRSTFNSGCMTPTSEQVQLTSETDTSDVSFRSGRHKFLGFYLRLQSSSDILSAEVNCTIGRSPKPGVRRLRWTRTSSTSPRLVC